MAPPEVDHKNLLAELEAMGFSVPLAINALQFSGNTSLEAAIDWIIDHDNEAHIDQVILDIPIEEPNSSKVPDHKSEQAHKGKEGEEKIMKEDYRKSSTKLAAQLVKSRQTSERKRYASEWKVKKEEERIAKERILQKLEQDKAERRGRLTLPTESPALLMKSDMSINQKKNNLELAESARKVELMEECLRSLRRQNMGNDAQVKTAFQTLLIYVTNVANFPDNIRFRRIHLSNTAFQKRVGNFKEGVEFLELCGFVKVERGELLFLPRDKVDMGLLNSACALLHSAITNPFFGLLSRPACQAT